MKQNTIKAIILSVFLFTPLFAFMKPAFANAPVIKGTVLGKNDHKPVMPQVWVKWTDGRNNVRYTQTDGNGEFLFPSWQKIPDDVKNELINKIKADTDGDGIEDTNIARMSGPGDGFGCGQNSHAFSVVKPVSSNGTFEDISGKVTIPLSFSNSQSEIDIGTFYYDNPNPPVCDCMDLTYEGYEEEFKPGGTVVFTTKISVTDPQNNPGKVTATQFKMQRNGIEIDNVSSAPSNVYRVSNQEIYETAYNFVIPTEGSGVEEYFLTTNSDCLAKTALNKFRDRMMGFAGKIFHLEVSAQINTPGVTDTCVKNGPNSLQLCTFIPQQIEKDCNSVRFTINYGQ
jgi:hypothetical protein